MASNINLDQLNLLKDSELIEFLELYKQYFYPLNTNRDQNLKNSKNLLEYVLASNKPITQTLLNLWIASNLNISGSNKYTETQILSLPRTQLLGFRQVFNEGLESISIQKDFIPDNEYLVNNVLQILRFKGLLKDELVDKSESGQLLPVQMEHFERVNDILNKRWYAYQDTTPMGGGKTFIVSELARSIKKNNPKLSILVVAPKAVHTKWRRVPTLFGVPVLDVINYETLAGKTGHHLKHPYLNRNTIDNSNNFTITPYYDEIVKRGILLVFDENQLVKNRTSLRSLASLALTRHIISLNNSGQSNSRIALLSASPGNNTDHTFSILKMLGVTTSIDVVVNGNPVGLMDVYNFAATINPMHANSIAGILPNVRDEALDIAHELYKYIIKPYISSASPMPDIAAGRDYKNGYYKITSQRDIELIDNGINILNELHKAKRPIIEENYDGEITANNKDSKYSMSIISTAMTNIESGKIMDLARIARKTLMDNKSCKVIVGVNYKNSVNRLAHIFASDNPLVLTGSIKSQKQRDNIVDEFQEPNTNRRLLIMITTVGSVGLDLDDKFGEFPRYMFIVPDFHFLTKYQATGRIARADTKSRPTLRFFYGRGAFVEESKLLDSIINKSDVAKDLLATDNPTPFPGDFESYVETG